MSGFISKAACRGRRPSQFASYAGFQRQGLIARLLKERGVARFIVAPSGYGKTCLAVDYAETVFSWVHSFFVNCQSPCFIRDLDDDPIAAACLKVDGDARLVVFDAVPPLDAARAKLFSAEIDALLASGCEVLVTCSPAADAFGQLQADQVRLGAADLLLSDDELDEARSADERNRMPSSQVGPDKRIPALVWGSGPESAALFLRRSFQEPVPTDVQLAMAGMYVLCRGTVDDLAAFGPVDGALMGHVLETYPHLGSGEGQGGFGAPLIPADALAQGLKSVMGALVERSAFPSRAALTCAWADALLAADGREGAERACDVVRTMCPRSHRGRWLASHALDLVRLGCFYPSIRLVRASSTKASDLSSGGREAVALLEAACLLALGDVPGAAARVRRLAFDGDATAVARTLCQLVLVQADAGAAAQMAMSELGETAAQELGETAAQALGGPSSFTLEGALALSWKASLEGVEELAGTWGRLKEAEVRYEVLCLVAAGLFIRVRKHVEAGDGFMSPSFGHDLGEIERFIRDRLEAEGPLPTDYFAAYAGLEMERAHVGGMGFSAGPLATRTLLDLRNAEMSLLRQRQRFEQEAGEEQSKRPAWSPLQAGAAHPAKRERPPQRAKRSVPVLELKTFGRFEVFLGGEPLEARAFGRRNVRSLLVLLAINQGRELSRALAMRSIWPNSSEEVARKNFYSVWSQLKSALTLPDGTCPYLSRHQYGCALEERYVQSDISRLGQICRELLFGRADVQEWSEIYSELDRDFAGDFMPTETSISLVTSARAEYRTRLVDALVAATQSIVEAGNPQWGIWFSRMAVARDELREDAYVSLMRAQAAADQRTAAIMTFLNCQRVLSEQLGVDPSPETMALYESLLE